MPTQEWSHIWRHNRLEVASLQATYIRHAYPRHTHDYYVICVIERGLQSFTHQTTKHFTPAGGVILINPGEVHTGEAADSRGFQMRSIYPTPAHLQKVVEELTGRPELPYFKEVRIDQGWARSHVVALHKALIQEGCALECESVFTWTLTELVKRYADVRFHQQTLGEERNAIRQARGYIEACYAQGITLSQLAAQVALSPYYLLRAFRAEVGMPPHAYLESVRIRHAQRLIQAGRPLAEVALEVGFSSQSHFTQRFKRIIGVTPGQYAAP